MENLLHARDALPPPVKVMASHLPPIIKRDAPILTPFLSEFVFFEIRLGRCASGPIESKTLGMSKNISAVIADPKGNVAHQRHPALGGEAFDRVPLVVGDPLHVSEKSATSLKISRVVFA